MPKTPLYTIGVDEVGRGPIAGPLLVCALLVPKSYDQRRLLGVRDSKQLSKEERGEWMALAKYERERGALAWGFGWVSPRQIDKKGMSWALRFAVAKSLKRLAVSHEAVSVLLDGSLYAPKNFKQETITKGDEKVPVISLASIIAKVVRDKKMEQLAIQYPEYGFEQHKGYGTKAHLEVIKKHGPCEIHRLSFLTRNT